LTPLGDETLQHVSLRERGGFICSIVDISSEKGAEITERNAAQAARDRKEQQERFIDMISHEIRNPLSAVLHCAEDIADAIRDKPRHEIDTDGIREAVETISLCVSHQKNIVDDVLSFSKLDASLLSLVPKPSSPSHQLAKTLKMFQHEFRKQDLAFRYTVDDTYRDAKVQIVLADMPRIGQVLINLITNAMKFTRLAKGEKRVICSVAASTTRPKSYPPNVVFFESEHTVKRMDATTSKEWGKGEEIYVMVAVKDTGIGISPEGQQRLFERFRQATPKTEEVYGGSGLGLNISRKICHLHGGEIGVSAKEGKGSTFGFFFKVRRAEHYPAGSGDGDATHALQGESRLQDQMKALGMSSPYDLERTEPFEWTPGRKASKLSGEGKYRNDQDAKDREEAAEGEKERDASHHRPRPTPQQLSGGGGDKLQSQALQKSDSAMQDARRPSVGLKRNGARAHVLLVEDNVINQKIVFRKLDAKGKTISLSPSRTNVYTFSR
jgi:signal transduction histidine kinase